MNQDELRKRDQIEIAFNSFATAAPDYALYLSGCPHGIQNELEFDVSGNPIKMRVISRCHECGDSYQKVPEDLKQYILSRQDDLALYGLSGLHPSQPEEQS